MTYHCMHFRPSHRTRSAGSQESPSSLDVQQQETPCQLASTLVGNGRGKLGEASRINSPSLYVHTYSYTAVVGWTTAKVANLHSPSAKRDESK